MLLAWASVARAQRGFVIKEPANFTLGAIDILEDYEGGLLVITGVDLRRYDAAGNFKWSYPYGYLGLKISYDAKNKLYIVGAQVGGWGGYLMMAFDLEGNKIWEVSRPVKDDVDFPRDYVHDYLIDTAQNRITISGVTRYFSPAGIREALWLAMADLRGNIYREERMFFFEKYSDGALLTNLNYTPSNGGYVAVARRKVLNFPFENAYFIRFDSLCRMVNYRFPSLREAGTCNPPPDSPANGNQIYDFNRLNDSQFFASLNFGSQWDPYFQIYDEDLNLVKCVHYKVDNSILKYQGIIDCDSFYFSNVVGDFAKYDRNLNLMFKRSIKIPGHPLVPLNPPLEDGVMSAKVKPSPRGGFYGYVRFSWWHDILYIFRLDSLGNVDTGKVEDPDAVRLAPNPASGRLRLEVPFYDRHVSAVFYDLQGRECLRVAGPKSVQHDISMLRPGLYIVHTTIQETGRKQILKLWVQ